MTTLRTMGKKKGKKKKKKEVSVVNDSAEVEQTETRPAMEAEMDAEEEKTVPPAKVDKPEDGSAFLTGLNLPQVGFSLPPVNVTHMTPRSKMTLTPRELSTMEKLKQSELEKRKLRDPDEVLSLHALLANGIRVISSIHCTGIPEYGL